MRKLLAWNSNTTPSVFLCLCVAWWWEWLVCLSLFLTPPLPVSVSTACHSWILRIYSAAILVTQLTTPYLRIAPAAGDNQLAGQICGCADAQTASPLLFTCCCWGDRDKQVVAVLLFPKAKISMIRSKSRQYLLPSSSHYYCTWKACLIVVWCVSVR